MIVALVVACGSSSDDDANGDDGGDGGDAANSGSSGSGGTTRSGGSAGRAAAGMGGGAGRGSGGTESAGRGGSGGTAGSVSAGSAGTPAGSGGSSGGNVAAGGTAGEPPVPTCDRPLRIGAPRSDEYQIYDGEVAYSPGVGVGVLWSSWPQGYEPYFALFHPETQSFDPPKRLATPTGFGAYSARDIDLAVLPEGGFVAAWVSQGNSYATFVVHPEADGDVQPRNMGSSIRDAGPTVATAPFFDGKVAVGYTDLVGSSYEEYQARVGIYEPDDTIRDYYDVSVPGSRDVSIQLLRAADRLLVLLSAVNPDSAEYGDLYLATIAPDDPPGPVIPTPLLEHENVYLPALSLVEGGFMLAYVHDDVPHFARFALDGMALGTPLAVPTEPPSLRIDALLFDPAGSGMLFTEPELVLHYAALDASYAQAPPSATIAVRDDIPHGVSLMRTDGGLFAGWYAPLDNIYVSPLCSDSSGEGGAGGMGVAGEGS